METRKMLTYLVNKLGFVDAARYCTVNSIMPYVRSVNYHSVPETTRINFRSHLRYFSKNFTNINEPIFTDYFHQVIALNRPGIVICFDDGYRDNYYVAAQELDNSGFTGWFFIIAGMVGKVDSHGQPYMSWNEIRDLRKRGHIIGSHTLSHEYLGCLSTPELKKQLVDSKRILENELGEEVNSFCFPFGNDKAYSKNAIAMAADNYRYLFTSCPGFLRKIDDKWNIGRAHVESDWDLSSVAFVSNGLFDWKYYKRRLKYETTRSLIGLTVL